jgi:hypothetical protein
MKKSIWKFVLETTDTQQIEMPEGAEILTIQTQNEHPCIWALVDPAAPKRKVTFEILGTGHIIYDKERKYIGTYQLDNGSLVFHCFLIN